MRPALAAAALVVAALPAAAAPFWSEVPAGRRQRPAPSLAALAERARPAVAHVRGTLPGEERAGRASAAVVSVGSGFFVDPAGHLVTNAHVVRGAVDLRVRLHDGRELVACVVGTDEPTDLALLRVEAPGPFPALPLADSDAVREGDTAVAIGSPFGFSHSVTAGVVSARERVVDRGELRGETERRGEGYSFFIQTDASINIGNSGGPLLDAWGAVIGINAAFWGGGGGQPAQGVGFAIPINIAKLLLPRLRTERRAPRSFVGVESQPLGAALAEALGLPAPRGALIAGVVPGSPAETAGLEPGDVVVGWGAHPVSTTEDFKIYAQLTPPQTRVRLRLVRDGRSGERVLTTRAADERAAPPHPAACGAAAATTLPEGFEAAPVPASRARDLPGGRGIEVVRVEGGAAREAGLVPGDVLLRAGRSPLGTVDDLRRAIGAWPAGRPIPLLVRRENADFWTALPRR